NQYSRVVRREGNRPAQELIQRVFQVSNRKWRGIGEIPASGLSLRPEFVSYDAEQVFQLGDINVEEPAECISGLVLQGLKKPFECEAFGKQCTPQTPLGATMVSAEGACAAYYAYSRHKLVLDEQ
ncbi:MAG: hydrogenase formation protein HypD, partial [bacterium]